MQIPQELINQIENGSVVLFLGAGASRGALHPDGVQIPDAKVLANAIAHKFLDDSYDNEPLATLSELAISRSDLYTFQNFIYEMLIKYKASEFHKLIATFKWKSIYTTNYDKIIEDAYLSTTTRLQELSPVFRNTKAVQIFRYANSLPYYKLHGCLDCINDPDLPLILTPEQYITHKVNREHLFSKLFEEAFNHPILFVGYSFGDIDVRMILSMLDQEKEGRSRSYLVGPGIRPAEESLWESKKITSIKSTFQDFIEALNLKIGKNVRNLAKAKPPAGIPIFDKFIINSDEVPLSNSLDNFIKNDIDFIHPSLSSPITSAKEFYKGYFENWDPILRNLDVQRKLSDDILSEVVLSDYYADDKEGQFLFVIKGFAGAGKSVLLKRIAWDAAVSFEKFCIFYKPNTTLRYENISELYNHVRSRIFIFVDNLMEKEDELIYLFRKAKKDKIPLTVISCERVNIWNNENNDIKKYCTSEFQLGYLTDKEIGELIILLEKHNSLGYLEKKTSDERKRELSYQAGRELLVALYEATNGKPFRDIVKDEYEKIDGLKAKSLYLTVCLLHRLNSVARAGLISRVHGVNFDEFNRTFFTPLEYIVFTRRDYKINDNVYLTRHPYIAEMVFETVLTTQQERYDEYVRIISFLDTDFESDRNAFISMTNAKKLMEIIPDYVLIRNLYQIAGINNSQNARFLQQESIFEAHANNLPRAEKLIREAYKLNKGDPYILHTFSELEFRKAESAKNRLEKEKYYRNTIKLAEDIIKLFEPSPHAFHSVLKSLLSILELHLGDNDPVQIEKLIKEVEKKFRDAKQLFPYQEFILEIESRFNQLLNNNPEALELLSKAYDLNKSSPFVASRLSRFYEESGELQKSLDVLKETLRYLPGDKDINFEYSRIYLKLFPDRLSDTLYYLRRSFTEGDSKYQAQFWYARTLYLTNDISGAKDIFKKLGKYPIDPDVKNRPIGLVEENGLQKLFLGIIYEMEASFGFVKRDALGDQIFFYRYDSNVDWLNLKKGGRVRFNLAFNYRGAVAVNIKALDN